MPIDALTQHCPIVVSKTKEEKILHNERVLQTEHSSFTRHVAKGEGRGEGLPPAQINKTEFARNKKHTFLMLCFKLQS